jgi:lipid-binding SYLF domain-containing protein
MISKEYKIKSGVTTVILSITLLSGLASAQSTDVARPTETQEMPSITVDKKYETAAINHVNSSVSVVRRMVAEPGINNLLQKAKGIFIVPAYARAAVGVGGSGGAGILLVKREGGVWGTPAFYNIGSINVGAQVGVEVGAIAMVLNNDKAVKGFMQKNDFSLNADAGLTVVNWNKTAQGSIGTGDVVAWSDTKGLFANVVSIGVQGIRFNANQTTAYYHQAVVAADVVNGKVNNPQSNPLREILDMTTGSTPAVSVNEDTDDTKKN